MSWSYGSKSMAKLNTCDPVLRAVAERALELSPYDITIIHGWRGEEVQNALQESGASTKRWPDSKHNHTENDDGTTPRSLAIDFGPWVKGDIPWNDTHIFACIAGCFFAAAAEMRVTLRWGGDWDSDGSTKDQKLMDWGHMELVRNPS
jgi:peptidoglycan L-alanyl-D-glutamate endopeptidase CwlK